MSVYYQYVFDKIEKLVMKKSVTWMDVSMIVNPQLPSEEVQF